LNKCTVCFVDAFSQETKSTRKYDVTRSCKKMTEIRSTISKYKNNHGKHIINEKWQGKQHGSKIKHLLVNNANMLV